MEEFEILNFEVFEKFWDKNTSSDIYKNIDRD